MSFREIGVQHRWGAGGDTANILLEWDTGSHPDLSVSTKLRNLMGYQVLLAYAGVLSKYSWTIRVSVEASNKITLQLLLNQIITTTDTTMAVINQKCSEGRIATRKNENIR